MDLVIQCITKKYVEFSSRASRKEFWLFILFYLIFSIILGFIDGIVGTYNVETGYGVFSGIFILVTLVPYLAVCVRRLHDTDRSGWWLLLWLVPLIGLIWSIVVFCHKGSDGENRFGANPLTPQGNGAPTNI
jgi:uncharacterized membrane protein YhaH (DUF805 family)